ncbi:MAG: hypothetical protein ACPGF7_13640 [Pontibacterium sp.]
MGSVGFSTEQVARLEEVDLDVVQDAPKRQQPKQIPGVDRRLVAWGEWMLSNSERYGQAAGVSMLGALIDGGGMIVRCTNPNAGSMPDVIFDTDKAVNQLDVGLQQVVRLQYMEPALTGVEKADRCGCVPRHFRRRLGRAHQEILFLLKAPMSLRSRKVGRAAVCQCV